MDCPDCGVPMYDTGCPRPLNECLGYGCQGCGYGCDRELVPDEDSNCIASTPPMDEDELEDVVTDRGFVPYESRVDAALRERP